MLRHLPIYRRASRQHILRQAVRVEDVVALVDRAFTAGYAAKENGRYLRPAKRRFLENVAEELRQDGH